MMTTEASAPVPLWDDEAIIAAYQRAFDRNPDAHHMALMCWIRDDVQAQSEKYAQKNDHLHSTCTEFAERIADLEAEAQRLREGGASDEVRETLRFALTELRDSEENNRSPFKEIDEEGRGYYELLHPELIEDVDTALEWLDSTTPTEVSE